MPTEFLQCVLLFHRLGPESDFYNVSPESFYRILNLSQELELATVKLWCTNDQANDLPRRLSLTFDDGCASDYEVAFPELLRRGMVATFFICTDFLGKDGYLTWGQLREMSRAGMEIGSHTLSHPYLSQLGPGQILNELKKSKAIIEDNLGKLILTLSLPGGDIPPGIMSLAHKAGYQIVATSVPGFHRGPTSFVRRNVVHRCTDLRALEFLMKFSYMAHLRRYLFYLGRTAAKKSLGLAHYDRLSRLLINRG